MKKNTEIRIFCNDCNREFGVSKRDKMRIVEDYKQATWNFMLEHSRRTKKNILCIFAITDKANIEGRIWARAKGYERKDFEKVIYSEVKQKIQANRENKYSKNRNIYLEKLAKKHLFLRLVFKLYKLI